MFCRSILSATPWELFFLSKNGRKKRKDCDYVIFYNWKNFLCWKNVSRILIQDNLLKNYRLQIIKDDKYNGIGILTHADGNKDVGEFKDGKINDSMFSF